MGKSPLSLFIHESDGIARSKEIADAGVQLPDGYARGASELVLRDASGGPCASQFRVMGRWPSGSIQWVHAQTPVSLSSSERLPFSLAADGRGPSTVPDVSVEQYPGKVLLQNEYLRVRIPKERFRFPGEALGAELPVHLRGVSLLGLLRGEADAPASPFAFCD